MQHPIEGDWQPQQEPNGLRSETLSELNKFGCYVKFRRYPDSGLVSRSDQRLPRFLETKRPAAVMRRIENRFNGKNVPETRLYLIGDPETNVQLRTNLIAKKKKEPVYEETDPRLSATTNDPFHLQDSSLSLTFNYNADGILESGVIDVTPRQLDFDPSEGEEEVRDSEADLTEYMSILHNLGIDHVRSPYEGSPFISIDKDITTHIATAVISFLESRLPEELQGDKIVDIINDLLPDVIDNLWLNHIDGMTYDASSINDNFIIDALFKSIGDRIKNYESRLEDLAVFSFRFYLTGDKPVVQLVLEAETEPNEILSVEDGASDMGIYQFEDYELRLIRSQESEQTTVEIDLVDRAKQRDDDNERKTGLRTTVANKVKMKGMRRRMKSDDPQDWEKAVNKVIIANEVI